jgi:hypothetical protein
MRIYTQATLKFLNLNTEAQQREAVVQWRSLPPIPALVYQTESLPIILFEGVGDENSLA